MRRHADVERANRHDRRASFQRRVHARRRRVTMDRNRGAMRAKVGSSRVRPREHTAQRRVTKILKILIVWTLARRGSRTLAQSYQIRLSAQTAGSYQTKPLTIMSMIPRLRHQPRRQPNIPRPIPPRLILQHPLRSRPRHHRRSPHPRILLHRTGTRRPRRHLCRRCTHIRHIRRSRYVLLLLLILKHRDSFSSCGC